MTVITSVIMLIMVAVALTWFWPFVSDILVQHVIISSRLLSHRCIFLLHVRINWLSCRGRVQRKVIMIYWRFWMTNWLHFCSITTRYGGTCLGEVATLYIAWYNWYHFCRLTQISINLRKYAHVSRLAALSCTLVQIVTRRRKVDKPLSVLIVCPNFECKCRWTHGGPFTNKV